MLKIIHITIISLLSIIAISCNDEVPQSTAGNSLIYGDSQKINPYTVHFDSMPPGGIRLRTHRVGSFSRTFNDSNHTHLASAIRLGISPITDVQSAWSLRQGIVKTEPCREYFVDSLTHSLPFLVPKAEKLLREIGQRFNDSLTARGGGYYRIKVTSVLRTPEAIAKLRRRNRNAVSTSAHQFGTTFDISYRKFICDSVNIPRTQDDLKNLLAEILNTMRNENRCLVKYERRQGCFHITTL